jgi:hypothetical protein
MPYKELTYRLGGVLTKGDKMKRLLIVLAMLGIFGLACNMAAPVVVQVATAQPTYTTLPTYTPYPTAQPPTATPYVAPTAQTKMGASDENTCALKFQGAGYTWYAVSIGVGLAAQCPALQEQLAASDAGSVITVEIVYTFPTEPVICKKEFGDGVIEMFIIDTDADMHMGEVFCGGLG